jgi:predicted NBD/HSP70 family sugar kinase
LLQQKIVTVKDYLPPTQFGGRKTRVLSLNPNWLKVLGVSVEQGELCWALADFSSNVVSCEKRTVDVNWKNLIHILRQAFESAGQFHAAVIAMPGLIDSAKNTVLISQALELKNFVLDGLIEKPFLLINDANAAAASYLSRAKNLVYFLLSIPYELSKPVGLGAGLIIDGKIYEGSNHSAGELGEGVPLTRRNLSLEDLERDPTILFQDEKTLNQFVESTAFKMATAINLVDPELFILGGDFKLLPERMLQRIVRKIEDQVTVRKVKTLNWQIDENGSKTVAVGAVRAFYERFFSDLDFARKVIERKGQDHELR